MQEAVEELYAVAIVSSHIFELFRLFFVVLFQRVEPFWFDPVAASLIEDLNLVEGGNEIVTGGPLNLESNIRVNCDVLGEPNCGEMTPA